MRKLVLWDVAHRFQLFPNGHPQFLTPEGLARVNEMRQASSLWAEGTMPGSAAVPWAVGPAADNTASAVMSKFRDIVFGKVTPDEMVTASAPQRPNRDVDWDRRSTVIPSVSTLQAGGRTSVFRICAIPDRDGNRSLDVNPGDTLTVRFLRPQKPKSRAQKRKRRLRELYKDSEESGEDGDIEDVAAETAPPAWAGPLLEDDFDPSFVTEDGERTLVLRVQDVFWGTRHLIDILDRGAVARRRDTRPKLQTTGYIVCDAII